MHLQMLLKCLMEVYLVYTLEVNQFKVIIHHHGKQLKMKTFLFSNVYCPKTIQYFTVRYIIGLQNIISS